MRSRAVGRDEQARQKLAREAARVMLESGINDFGLAKRKAQERMRVPPGTPLPSNQEIEEAVREHQRLFSGGEQLRLLAKLREIAAEAMRELAFFKPRLVGPVLAGTADRYSAVCLHLFADSPEEVGFNLLDRAIPHRNTEHRLRMSTGQTERVPGYSFLAGEVEFELLVFSGKTRGHTPLSPVDGRAMKRASLAEVECLIASADWDYTG